MESAGEREARAAELWFVGHTHEGPTKAFSRRHDRWATELRGEKGESQGAGCDGSATPTGTCDAASTVHRGSVTDGVAPHERWDQSCGSFGLPTWGPAKVVSRRRTREHKVGIRVLRMFNTCGPRMHGAAEPPEVSCSWANA